MVYHVHVHIHCSGDNLPFTHTQSCRRYAINTFTVLANFYHLKNHGFFCRRFSISRAQFLKWFTRYTCAILATIHHLHSLRLIIHTFTVLATIHYLHIHSSFDDSLFTHSQFWPQFIIYTFTVLATIYYLHIHSSGHDTLFTHSQFWPRYTALHIHSCFGDDSLLTHSQFWR